MTWFAVLAVVATVGFGVLSVVRVFCHFDITCLHARHEHARLAARMARVQVWQRCCLAIAVTSLALCIASRVVY